MNQSQNTVTVAEGVAHIVPTDLKHALLASNPALKAWNAITPLARNEWICWVESVKKQATRTQHISRAIQDLKKGKRRPCCWIGCVHRTDKAMSPSQKFIIEKKAEK